MDAEKIAREVANELRKRGIWANALLLGIFLPCVGRTIGGSDVLAKHVYSIYDAAFDNLTALEIAGEIQAQEARRAQEWAGDT